MIGQFSNDLIGCCVANIGFSSKFRFNECHQTVSPIRVSPIVSKCVFVADFFYLTPIFWFRSLFLEFFVLSRIFRLRFTIWKRNFVISSFRPASDSMPVICQSYSRHMSVMSWSWTGHMPVICGAPRTVQSVGESTGAILWCHSMNSLINISLIFISIIWNHFQQLFEVDNIWK